MKLWIVIKLWIDWYFLKIKTFETCDRFYNKITNLRIITMRQNTLMIQMFQKNNKLFLTLNDTNVKWNKLNRIEHANNQIFLFHFKFNLVFYSNRHVFRWFFLIFFILCFRLTRCVSSITMIVEYINAI